MQDAKPSAGASDLPGGGFTPAKQAESQTGSTAGGDATGLAVNPPAAEASGMPTPALAVSAATPVVPCGGKPLEPPPPAPLGMASVEPANLRSGSQVATAATSPPVTPTFDSAKSSPMGPALTTAAPAGSAGDGKPAILSTAAPPPAATGFKAVTVGQIWEYAEAAAKFWPIIAAAVAATLFVYNFFAPASAVQKINCELKWRGVVERQRSTSVLLYTQITDRADQVTTLTRMRAAVAEVQVDNNNTIMLERLKKEIDELVQDARRQRVSMTDEAKKADEAIKQAEDELTKCSKTS